MGVNPFKIYRGGAYNMTRERATYILVSDSYIMFKYNKFKRLKV